MPKKIIIAAGGSGGHLYPAISLAKQLQLQSPNYELLFVAAGLDSNPFFDKDQFAHRSISAGTFKGWSMGSNLKTCRNIAMGYMQSRRILNEHRPDLIVGFGSYHTLPLLLAAHSKKFPIALHEQNSKPGRVIRHFSSKAVVTGVYFTSAIPELGGKCVQLAMPLREGYRKDTHHKEKAYSYFNLNPTKQTILVFGGSQGAQFINNIASEAIATLVEENKNVQILHFTGNLADTDLLRQLYKKHGIDAVVKKYEDRMELAWQIADICITRAGAGSIAEQLEFEVPGILIPYPHAADAHQECNADFFVNVVGGGWKCLEKDLDVSTLASLCKLLLTRSNGLLNEMKVNLLKYRQQACTKEFLTIIEELLEK